MKGLAVHQETKKHLDAFLQSPSHAVLLSGPKGSGKHSLAYGLAARLLGDTHLDISNHPYVLHIYAPEGKSLGIESIRQLEHFLSLKVPGKQKTDRIVLIENSETMTPEAQNAMLKTLEEPPRGTVIILTVTAVASLLPTVRSRMLHIPVLAPTKAQLREAFSSHPDKDFSVAFSISGGLPGMMNELLTNDDHPLRIAATTARELLQKSTYERLIQVDALSKDTHATKNLLYILQQMASIQLRVPGVATTARWQNVLDAAYETERAISQNAQAKLALSNLMLML